MIEKEVQELLSFIDGNPTAYHTTASVRNIPVSYTHLDVYKRQAPHCAKTMALSFCLRDTAAFPAALHLRHPLYKRASPEGTVLLRRARLFQFFRRTAVRDRKTIPYSVLVHKTFCISYAAFSSVMPTDEFCFGITFVLPHHSAAINLFYFSFGSAPSNPRAFPSGLASPFSFAVS